jgi:hypothetical protein
MGNEVIKVLDHLCDKFGIAIDWTSANVMPYLQDLMSRIVKYGIYQNVSDIIYCLILLSIIALITRKLYKTSYKYASIYDETNEYDDKSNAMFFTTAFMISLAITVITSIIVLCSIKASVDEIIELSTVPEKYVIEMIQEQIDE